MVSAIVVQMTFASLFGDGMCLVFACRPSVHILFLLIWLCGLCGGGAAGVQRKHTSRLGWACPSFAQMFWFWGMFVFFTNYSHPLFGVWPLLFRGWKCSCHVVSCLDIVLDPWVEFGCFWDTLRNWWSGEFLEAHQNHLWFFWASDSKDVSPAREGDPSSKQCHLHFISEHNCAIFEPSKTSAL